MDIALSAMWCRNVTAPVHPSSKFKMLSPSVSHVILLTILTLGAGGRFDFHFWTQSGAPSPYLAFRAPPAFKLYMVLKACPAFNPYLALRAPLPPLSSYIWCWKRAPPAFNPYLALRAPPRFQALYGVESVPRFQPIFSIQSAPPLSSYILCWKRAHI